MSAEDEVRRQRELLAAAVNGHDLEAVRAFMHPTYVGRARGGAAGGYADILALAERLLAPGQGLAEAVQVEAVAVAGDAARLTVRRTREGGGWLAWPRGPARAVETWWRVGGRWLLVEEQEL
jgi:SnoaL-like domain